MTGLWGQAAPVVVCPTCHHCPTCGRTSPPVTWTSTNISPINTSTVWSGVPDKSGATKGSP